jgi:hypothetical protein
MTKLPIAESGFPVPWFVAFLDGKPDFRVIREGGIPDAYYKRLCWLCGEKLGTYGAFVVGPMCGINRVTMEPPSHRKCAEYAVRACPFLTRPLAKRDERGLEGAVTVGIMLKRNPGVTLLWITRQWRPFQVDNGSLFRIGEPTECLFFARGRKATSEEVLASVDHPEGFQKLEAMARRDGGDAMRELREQRRAFDRLLEQAA